MVYIETYTTESEITFVENNKTKSALACDSFDVSLMSANQEAIVAHVHFPSAPSLFEGRNEDFFFRVEYWSIVVHLCEQGTPILGVTS